MSRNVRRIVAPLVTALVLACLTACGSDEPGTHAEPGPAAAFCAAAKRVQAADGSWKRAQRAAKEWRRTGLPKAAPANVRRGFRLGIRLIVSSRNEKQVDRRVRALSPIQHDDLRSVDGYLAEVCAS